MRSIKETLLGLIESDDRNTLQETLHQIRTNFKAKVYLLLDLKEERRQLYLIKDMDAKEDLLILSDGMMNSEEELAAEEPCGMNNPPIWYSINTDRISVTYEMFCYMSNYNQKMTSSGKIWPIHGIVLLDNILLNKDKYMTEWSDIDITVCDRIIFHDKLISGARHTNMIDLEEIRKKSPSPSLYHEMLSSPDEDEEEDFDEDDTEFNSEKESEDEDQKGIIHEIDILDMVGEDNDFYETTPLEKRFDPPACKVYGPISRPLDELEGLVGLEKVKSTIDSFTALAKYYALISELKPDFKKPKLCKHALFLGNPGTAKTTIGNIWASILYENDLLSTGRTIVCSRETFIGRYYGDAERRWKQVIKLAKRGALLYIDEAYLLAPPDDPKDAGHSIIQFLLKAIDEHPDMCVVLAGYPDKIMDMMKINPGLLGRFRLQLEFNDLDVKQLVEVTLREFERRGYKIPADTQDKIENVLEIMYGERDYSWSNARECHNLVEQVICKVASRVMSCTSPSIDSLFTILPEDVAPPEKYVISPKDSQRRKIGFR